MVDVVVVVVVVDVVVVELVERVVGGLGAWVVAQGNPPKRALSMGKGACVVEVLVVVVLASACSS